MLTALLSAGSATAVLPPVEQVQLLAGTDMSSHVSNGNTLPQVKRPWGFNDWVPHTSGNLHDNPWWFTRKSTSFKGLKCSHQPSPWLGDWGYFSIMPNIGNAKLLDTGPAEDADSGPADIPPPIFRQGAPWLQYSPSESTWKPYLFSTSLGTAGSPDRIKFEFTPTSHAGAGRVIFSPGSTEDGAIEVQVPKGLTITNGRILSGYTTTAEGQVPDGFQLYFVMNFSRQPIRVDDQSCFASALGFSKCSLTRIIFGPDAGTVEFGVATSLISLEQAALNLKQQVSGKTFEEVAEEGRRVWSQALGRVSVEMQDDEQHKVFYTNLWKSMLFPRFLQETDQHGNEVHYSPFNGKVEPGKLVVDSGFWDAYHTVYPLNSVLFPENLGHLMDGWVNAYKENGWIPQWASPGNRDSMVGTMSDVSLADAIVKSEAGGFSFDRQAAYEAIRKDAAEQPAVGDHNGGRRELLEYNESGFVAESAAGGYRSSGRLQSASAGLLYRSRRKTMPVVHQEVLGSGGSGHVYDGMLHKVSSPDYPGIWLAERAGAGALSGWNTESVARSLNNAVADAAVARAADALGRASDAAALSARSRTASRALFNRETKFFQPKDDRGSFTPGFQPLAWRQGFTEGSAYHYRFYLPHDVELLQELHNGDLCSAIKEDLEHTEPPAYLAGGYGYSIHEMREHEAVQKDFGMYNHCNQPAHEVLWVAKKAGCDELADKYLRRVMDKLYTTQGWCGDEDNGEMGAWYVLSALGIYSLEGAKDEMVLGSPAVARASVRLPGDRGSLTVVAENQGRQNVYVQSVTWTPTGGLPEAVAGNVIKYSALMGGGELRFTMGGSPRAGGAVSQHVGAGDASQPAA